MDRLLAIERLDALGNAAAILEYPLPREPDEATCQQGARVVDALLVRVAKGRGALDIAIGDGLLALTPRKMELGFATIGDYAREKLGIAASTAQKMARSARELQKRPILRKAVWAGEVPMRAAEAVFPAAIGEQEAEWVELARTSTVRALRAALKEQRAPGTASEPQTTTLDEDDERWGPIRSQVTPGQMATIDEAMEVARKIVDAAAPRWKLLEALFAEYLGGHDAPDFAASSPDELVAARREESDALREWLEQESAQWAFLEQPVPIAAPLVDLARDVHELHRELGRLATLRNRWDDVFGHLALLFRSMNGARRLGFASFEHYCTERLGMAVRSVEQRIALERKFHELPALKEAMNQERVSYEQARLVARHATAETVDAWIERAEAMPCIDLRRELQTIEKAQMCARGMVEVWAPRRVMGMFAMACGAARKAAGRWISDGECFERIASHFLDVWKPVVEGRATESSRILDRDDGLCRVPGCSLAADHAHHIKYKSAGGSDAAHNRVSLCAAHHLHGVHMGWIKVSGTAPDGLRWELGAQAPLL